MLHPPTAHAELDNTYNIYRQKDWEMDMFTHLKAWISILEERLGRPLLPSDYIFPHIPSNGLINPSTPLTHDVVQHLLTEFSLGAGVDRHYTTHSLRRGGAQHRLMFAPLGERWSLSVIRWWGGWAIGEHISCQHIPAMHH
jgi:integrase